MDFDFDSIGISMLNNQENFVSGDDNLKRIKFREERMDDALYLCPILVNDNTLMSKNEKDKVKSAWKRYLRNKEPSDLHIIQGIYSKLIPRSKSPFDYCYYPLWTLNRLLEVL